MPVGFQDRRFQPLTHSSGHQFNRQVPSLPTPGARTLDAKEAPVEFLENRSAELLDYIRRNLPNESKMAQDRAKHLHHESSGASKYSVEEEPWQSH
jgi:hypothetical protein